MVEFSNLYRYLTDSRYGWVGVCLERFGQAPREVLDEWNSVVHSSVYRAGAIGA